MMPLIMPEEAPPATIAVAAPSETIELRTPGRRGGGRADAVGVAALVVVCSREGVQLRDSEGGSVADALDGVADTLAMVDDFEAEAVRE